MKNYNIYFGALTSKPYAFKARSWELKSIETIDLFDSLCSNIRVDIRGSDIMRILPINNNIVNDEWISDKARFAYDSLKRQRFINPMINKNGLFIQSSWRDTLHFINNTINSSIFNNFLINTGNFTDLEHIVSLRNFSKEINKKISISINSKDKLNADLQEYYLLNDKIFKQDGQKVLILVGINIRLENPILNIKFRRLSNSNNILIGYIGSRYNTNINFIHLSTNISILNKIFSGKHYFCALALNFRKTNQKNNKIKNFFKSKFSIIFGNESNNIKNFLNTIETVSILSEISKFFDFNVLYNYSGQINVRELGFYNNSQININKKTIFYLLNTEILSQFKQGDFVIFQGHHNTRLRKKINVILPNITWIEKSSLYMNCLGYIQKTQNVTRPPINTRDDFKITVMLTNLLINTNKKKYINFFYDLDFIHFQLNNLSPNIMNFVNSYKIDHLQNLIFRNDIKKFIKISIMPFKSFIHNYYKVLNIEKFSKIMRKCSNSFESRKTNFLK